MSRPSFSYNFMAHISSFPLVQLSMTSSSNASLPRPRSFEEALDELEKIVSRMETGNMPIEESLAAYQKGIALLRECQEVLNTAEQQINILQGDSLQPLFLPPSDDDQKD